MLDNIPKDAKFLSRMKVLQSHDLLAILKTMESGAIVSHDLNQNNYRLVIPHVFAAYKPLGRLSVRNFRTLLSAGLIKESDDLEETIEYRLTYKGSIEEMVRGVTPCE